MYRMLTDGDINSMAPRMGVPLEFCGFKSDLPYKIKANKSYIINLDSEEDLDGDRNTGTHWTCFQVMEYPNGKTEAIYFDSYGVAPPQIVSDRIKRNFDIKYVPYNTKNIQSMMSDACGWYCMAFLHFINENPLRTRMLYTDVETFLDLFNDLEKKVDWKYNEWMLKQFFQAKDPAKRKPIDVIGEYDADKLAVFKENEGVSAIPVETNWMN